MGAKFYFVFVSIVNFINSLIRYNSMSEMIHDLIVFKMIADSFLRTGGKSRNPEPIKSIVVAV